MAKLNVQGIPSGRGPLGTSPAATGKTHEGGTGFERNPQSELFLRATTMFAGQDSFYEKARSHDERSIELALKIAKSDWEWITGFLPWLRASGNIRTMPIMLTAHVVHDALSRGFRPVGMQMTLRKLVASVIGRPDELKEMAQYWTRTFGTMPKPVKRGIADAASRHLNQRNVLRWDKPGPMMFADICELTHPKKRLLPAGTDSEPGLMVEDSVQGHLYQHLITSRHNREGYVPNVRLPEIRARWDLSRMEPAARHQLAERALDGDAEAREEIRRAAAGQWEWILPWLGEYKDEKRALSKRQQWELIVPELGYMALIRNLRNLDESGIRDSLANQLAQRIADPAEVAKSRQLPFRFLSAYLNAPSLRWGNALEQAINHCIPNVPELDGRTLILIDTSGSMLENLGGGPQARGKRATVSRSPSMMTAAAVFGLALALKNEGKVDVWGFADGQFIVDSATLKGTSLLKAVESFTAQAGVVGYGTQIEAAVRAAYKGQDRVVIFTDMQTFPAGNAQGYYSGYLGWGTGDITNAIPGNIHAYGFNLAGYAHSAMASGSMYRHELGGLTDHTFRLIPLLEAGVSGRWPWQAMPGSLTVPDNDDDE